MSRRRKTNAGPYETKEKAVEKAVRTLAALKTQDDDPAISRLSSSGGSGRIPPKREMESEITASMPLIAGNAAYILLLKLLRGCAAAPVGR
jgi:hypothetical protein